MKICPVCQSNCSDSHDYCPCDQAKLVRYDLRAELRARRADARPPRGESWLMPLSNQWLPLRLQNELSFAVGELRKNPRRFLLGMVQGDPDPGYRHSLHLSAAIVLTGLSACFSVAMLLVGLLRPTSAGTSSFDKVRDDVYRDVVLVPLLSKVPASGREGARHVGARGGSLREPQRAGGGGGGGQRMPEPPERGETAIASLQPPVLPPSPVLPKVELASLMVPETVFADPRSLPPLSQPVGDPRGNDGVRSGGAGEDGGLGQGRQGGIGPDVGSGLGPGRRGGTGGGLFRLGGGSRNGDGPDDEIPWANSRLSPTIVYKEKARYTEEARQNQVQGTVVLRATFSADGRITDIRVIRGLPAGLTENAIRAAQRIRFQPALSNGVPITVFASLEFNFALY